VSEASPRGGGWRPRVGLTARPKRPHTAPRPAKPRPPLRDSGGVLASPVAVAGDVVLSGEGATADLSERSAARLTGRAIAISGLLVVAGVVLARILGWARTSVFGAEFGFDDGRLTAFWAAFRIPDTLFQLVAAGAIGSALVPVASELLAKGEEDRARRLIATVANLMLLVLAPLVVLLYFAAPPLVGAFAGGGDLSLAIDLTRIMLLSPVLLAVGAVMAAGLNSIGVFGPPAMAPNVYNVVIIVAAILLTPFLGIYALAVGVVLGAAGHVLTQARSVGEAGLWRPVLDYRDPAVVETLTLMAPRALGLGATQLVFFVNTYFAVSLDPSALPVYTAAFTALQIPVGLIGVPLGIVLLPPLSQAIARGDDERFRALVDQSLRMLLFVVVPLTGVMFSLATPTLDFLYRYGSVTEANMTTMTPVFIVFLVGLVAHVLIALLAPIFYAGKDTRTPVTAALVAVAVDVGSAIVLFPIFGLEGLALAISLGAWAEVGLLVAFMEHRIGFDLRPMARHAVLFAAGGIVCSAAALIGYQVVERVTAGSASFLVRAADLIAGGLLGSAVYLGWAWALRLPELGQGAELMRTLFRRSSRRA
jgi:putative peptidoglycan lipid II flippase